MGLARTGECALIDPAGFLISLIDLFERPELRSRVVTALVGAALVGVAAGKMWERLRSPATREFKADAEKAEEERNAAKVELKEARAKIASLQVQLKHINDLQAALGGDNEEVWNLRKANAPADFYSRMMRGDLKVITVCNQKGGVGKTTLVACLAGYFETVLNKRVLVIDFDYQGSQTRMMLRAANAQLGDDLLAEKLLGGGEDAKWAVKGRELTSVLPNTRLVTCGQTFEAYEWRQLLSWLLRAGGDDIRFRLAELMIGDYVRKNYNVVLIDAPPRQSLGTVNALCASHAIIVPTVLDELSAETVRRFLQRVNTKLRPLNPALAFAGIVGTITEQTKLKDHEEKALEIAARGLELWDGNPGNKHVFRNHIRHYTTLAQTAGRKIGYFEDKYVKNAFDALGGELADKLGMKTQVLELAS
jgi:cellulose biosynthesis protein BcsQ